MKLLCWLRGHYNTLRYTFMTGIPMSGHEYQEIETHENVTVTISKCKTCGAIDIFWIK